MSEIKENQKAVLTFKLDDDSEKEISCIVKEVQKDRISLTFPEDMLIYADYFGESTEVPVRICTPNGVKVFETIVINSPLEDEFVIEFGQETKDIQRRKYKRAPMKTKVIINREDNNIVTQTMDLSGGGIRFSFDGEFYPNEEVGVMLYLPFQIRSIKAKGTIIEKEYLPKNECVVVFTKIENQDREKIIKNCTEKRVNFHPASG